MTTVYDSSTLFRTGRKSGKGSAVLVVLLTLMLCFGFLFLAAASRKSLLLRPIVRTGFQFVAPTGETIEVENFLRVFGHDQRTMGVYRRTRNTRSSSRSSFASVTVSFRADSNWRAIFAVSRLACCACSFDCAALSRRISSSASWITRSLPAARNIPPSASPSIITPTITATSPETRNAAIQSSKKSPATTRRQPTSNAISDADSNRSHHRLLLLAVGLSSIFQSTAIVFVMARRRHWRIR